jgi:hypothetical protein
MTTRSQSSAASDRQNRHPLVRSRVGHDAGPRSVPEKVKLVRRYGTRWARNADNLARLRQEPHLSGVYVLYDGSTPVYIGRGRIASRIRQAHRSTRRGQSWDHFSWYGLTKGFEAEVEALLLTMLPFYLRSLNQQRARFVGVKPTEQANWKSDPIDPPNLGPRRKR